MAAAGGQAGPAISQGYAAAQLRITNVGSAPIKAHVDAVTLADHQGQIYLGTSAPIQGCPGFEAKDFHLAPGPREALGGWSAPRPGCW